MPREVENNVTVQGRVPESVRDFLRNLCLSRGWKYGQDSPDNKKLFTQMSRGVQFEIGGKSFFIFPLDDQN